MTLSAAVAQTNTAPKLPVAAAITYDATRSNFTSGNSFWMEGGSIQLTGDIAHHFAITADVAGMHSDNMHSSGVPLDMVTATFGPRFTWSLLHARTSVFVQALAGEAFGFHSVFPGAVRAGDSADSLAVKAGGGVNLALSPHIGLRAFEADWVRTELPNSTTNVQNNLRLGAGIILRFR